MSTAAQERTTTTSNVRGRKGPEGQEAAIKMQPIKDAVEDAVELYNKLGQASEQFNDAIKAMAEKSGMLAVVVRKLVTARAGEKFDDEKRKVEQLSLIFEEVGDE